MSIMLADVRPALTHNLFFALLPAKEERERIGDLIGALRIGGVPMRLDHLHITIFSVILDDVLPPGLVQKVSAIAASILMPSFWVIFDRIVGGQRSAMLLPSEPLEAVRLFRDRLALELRSAGIIAPQIGRLSPHVTLLYGGQPTAEIQIEPISWLVREFVLIDSFIGETKHVEMGRWPLLA